MPVDPAAAAIVSPVPLEKTLGEALAGMNDPDNPNNPNNRTR